MNGELMAAEIAEQPDVFARILNAGSTIQDVANAVRARAPRFVLFVARGTSDHAALYAKYLVETVLELPAGLVSPSTMTVYNAHPAMQDVLFIAVSQSGASPDLVEPLARARQAGGITVAITNRADSPLADAAEFHLDVLAGPERAVAATKTYTAELLTLYLLIATLAQRELGEVQLLPDLAAAVLANEDLVAEIAIRYRFADQLVVTARGYNYPTARETALKLMETSYLVAHAFSSADLLHGPMAIIDRGFPVILILPEGPGAVALQPVIDQLHSRAADVLVVGGEADASLGTVSIPIPVQVSELLSPLLYILPMQQFAWHLARQRGSDPDAPRGLSKVTETW